MTIPEVDWFIPHQANQRILAGVAHRVGIDEDKVISTVALHANTSAASIPLAFAQESPTAASGRASCCCSRRWAAD